MKIWHCLLGFLLLFAVTPIAFCADSESRSHQEQPRSGPILPADTDWGAPVKEERLVDIPELPKVRGWYHYFGTMQSPGRMTFTGNLAFLVLDDFVVSLDIENGQERWRFPLGQYSSALDTIPFADPKYIFIFDGKTLSAVDTQKGSLYWTREGFKPIALGEGLVWVTRERRGYRDPWSYGEDLLLLEAKDAQVVKEFKIGRVFGYAGVEADVGREIGTEIPPAGSLIVKGEKDFLVIRPDGESSSFPIYRKEWAAEIAATGKGIFLAEYNDRMFSAGGDSRYHPDPPELREHGGRLASLRDWRDGSVKWRKFLIDEIYHSFGPHPIKAADEYVVLTTQTGAMVVNLRDGSIRFQTETLSLGGGLPGLFALNGDTLYLVKQPHIIGNTELYAVDLEKGTPPKAILKLQFEPKSLAVSRDRLFIGGETWREHDYWGRNAHLLAVELGRDGKPIGGTMTKIGLPNDSKQLTERFLKSSDPISDGELMRDSVRGGANFVEQLSKRIRELTPGQLDGLLTLAVYLEGLELKRVYEGASALTTLFGKALALKLPERSKHIARWLEDTSVKVAWPEILGLLAVWGGKEGKEALDHYYEDRLVKTHDVPPSPFDYPKPKRALGRHEGGERGAGGETISDVWVETKTKDGKRLVAFLSPGLVSARDIYLGIDKDKDGKFEEILATGLTDTYFYNVHPGGIGGPGKRSGSLKLVISGDTIKIKHHTPIIKKREYGYNEIVDAKYIETKLRLSELRKDSDSDGLPDVTERLLFTDSKSPDTDKDGIPDKKDPCPGAPAGWSKDKRVRAVQRALIYFYTFNTGRWESFWWESKEEKLPLKALYMELTGATGVNFAPRSSIYGIPMGTPDRKKAYHSKLEGYNADSLVQVEYVDERAIEKRKAEGRYGYTPEEEAQMEEDYEKEMGLAAKQFVTLGFTTDAYSIPLVEIDGELYPVLCTGGPFT